MANFHLVFIPAPFVGHLYSTVEFAKHLVNRDNRLSITVFIMKFPFDNDKKLSFSSTPRIKFVQLILDPSMVELLLSKPRSDMFSNVIKINKPRIRDYLSSEVNGLAAFVVDMFCTEFIDLAIEFSIPTYSYFTASAGFLSLIFHLQTLEDEYNQDIHKFKDSDDELSVLGFSNLVPARVLPADIIDKESGFPKFLDIPRGLRKTNGILVNTFTELESNMIKSLSNENKVPQIYPIGPLLTSIKKHDNPEDAAAKTSQSIEVMSWLDDQPPSSVVLFCFGSMGSFEKEQIVEIANALQHSGHRFLWVLRRPPPKGKREAPTDYENLDDVLPEGFIHMTSKLGKVVGWVPQVEVLSHPAVGGFVSHCGWNSTLESLSCGVPIATWPLYAEQKFNAFELIKELELAVEIKMDYNKDVVLRSDEIERGIRLLMDDKDCSDIRRKVKDMAEKSKLAVEIDGSSYNAVGRFIDDLIATK